MVYIFAGLILGLSGIFILLEVFSKRITGSIVTLVGFAFLAFGIYLGNHGYNLIQPEQVSTAHFWGESSRGAEPEPANFNLAVWGIWYQIENGRVSQTFDILVQNKEVYIQPNPGFGIRS